MGSGILRPELMTLIRSEGWCSGGGGKKKTIFDDPDAVGLAMLVEIP